MTKRLLIPAILGCLSLAARAEEMNGYIAPMGTFSSSMGSNVESGTRTGLKVEFARLFSYVSADLKFGTGQGYTDYGTDLRFYRHFSFNSGSSTGVSVGGAMGANWSPDGGVTSASRGFYEPYIYPFARFLWDFGNGFGVNAELGWELVLTRRFIGGSGPSADSSKRSRVILAIGVPFGV